MFSLLLNVNVAMLIEKAAEKGIFQRKNTNAPWSKEEFERINSIFNLEKPSTKKDYGNEPIGQYYSKLEQALEYEKQNNYADAIILLASLLQHLQSTNHHYHLQVLHTYHQFQFVMCHMHM